MDDPSEKNWTPFIPHNPAIKIDGLSFFKDHLVVSEREGGLNTSEYCAMSHRVNMGETQEHIRRSHRIATDETDYAMGLGANPEFDTSSIRYTYQSMVTPASVYEYDLNTKAADAAEAAGCARRLRSRRSTRRSASGRRRGTARRCRSRSSTEKGTKTRWHRADAALRLRILRRVDGADVLVERD